MDPGKSFTWTQVASRQRVFALVVRQGWWAALSLLILLLAVGYVWRRSLKQKQAPSAVEATQLADVPPGPSLGPPGGEEVRILAGASRSFIDHADKLWNADAWFTGGTAVKSPNEHIARTLDPGFYRTSRQGQFRYDIPLHKGVYELRLHFAETVYGPESSGTEGKAAALWLCARTASLCSAVSMWWPTPVQGLTADVKVFTGIEPAADGLLHLEFSADNGQQAILSAIEILPGVRGRFVLFAFWPGRRHTTRTTAIGGALTTTSMADSWLPMPRR